MRYTVVHCAFLLTLFTNAAQAVQTPISEHYLVIGLEGKWRLYDNGSHMPMEQVKAGQILNADAFIIRDTTRPTSTGKITIAYHGHPLTYACDDDKVDQSYKRCPGAISIAKIAGMEESHKTPFSQLLEQVLAILPHNSELYFAAMSRDLGSLEDAVVKQESDRIDWSPAFKELQDGKYRAQIRRVYPNRTNADTPMKEAVITWNRSTHSLMGAPEDEKGLLQMHIATMDGENVGDVWILVQDTKHYADASKKFDDLKKVTDTWGNDVPASGVEAIHRAALVELSRE